MKATAINTMSVRNAETRPSETTNSTSTSSISPSELSLAGASEPKEAPGGPGVSLALPAMTTCNGTTVQAKEFQVYEKLSECVDSMLFDSDTNIAYLQAATTDGSYIVGVDLMVRGEVSVCYKGKTYHKPSQFPQELRDRIKAHPGNWENPNGEKELGDLSDEKLDFVMGQFDPDTVASEDEDDVYISCNNWFEYIYTITPCDDDGEPDEDEKFSDGIMCEENIAASTEDELLTAMLTVAKEIIEREE